MNVDEDTNRKIQDLQILEQNFQNILMQKQTFQIESSENATALEELENTKKEVFRVLGQIMLKADKDELKKELEEKKELLNMRIKALEKQELSVREQIERLRGEIVNKLE
ncbi:MAG: prefoldin subunit beta [Candidatus Pacearchaeota archaeon]